jgi:hypothetical protein
VYLLYSDETNFDPATSEFFTYAGLAIPDTTAGQLSAAVDALRKEFGYRPEDVLKFNTKERPSHVTPDTHREIKRRVIEKAAECEVKLFASVILHRIATSPEEARRNEINRVCYHFNCYLHGIDDYGLVLIDTFQDNLLARFLREKFSVGLVGMPYSATLRLDRVLGFHLASIGSSNFCSVVDIVVGALRYAINARNSNSQLQVAQLLLAQLSPLLLLNADGRVEEISFFFSPKTVRVPAYRQLYQELGDYLAESGLDCTQRFTSL